MPETTERVRDIFVTAVERYQPDQWPGYLDRACAGDVALRRQVEQLLSSHQQLGSFHEDAPTIGVLADSLIGQPGTMVGPYKLLEQIGEGGMGVVYMAAQSEPIKRRVALKIIKPGMDTRKVIARFEAEQQALAMMDHPNIAKALDAGATDTGRPYFVMELVKGVPITDYCDQCDLSTGERLQLFVTVCQAVQHAHQKGIIHRDLKPSNLLVAMQDDVLTPKIIDFGVAKATSQRLTGETHLTTFTQILGTPLYMSPEQAELSPMGVDTRTDIYSLGVVLYELLTGTTPFDKQRLRTASFDELRRIIREEDPPRPSVRLSTYDVQRTTTVADRRRVVSQQLLQQLRGDLDWIVMKCLEKERRRRYASASALADDVLHYLNDEPVTACPTSPQYRMRKFLVRNKHFVVSGALVFITLLTLVCLMYFRVRNLTTQLKLEQAQLEILEQERSRTQAEARARVAEAEKIDAHVDALVEEALRLGSGVAPDCRRAEQLLTEAIKNRPDDPRLKLYRGSIRYEQGKYEEAIADLKQVIAVQPENFPSAHWLIALAAKNLGDEATARRHQELGAQQDPDSTDSLVIQALAMPFDQRGIEFFDRAIERSPFDPLLYYYRGRAAFNLTVSTASQKWYELAIDDLEKALLARPHDLRIRDTLSRCYVHYYFLADPQSHPLKRVQWLLEQWFLEADDDVQPYIIQANLHLAEGDAQRAVDTCSVALEMGTELAEVHTIRGWSYCRLGDYATAISSFSKALARTPENNVSERISILAGRGSCYAHLKQNDLAYRDLQTATAIRSPDSWKVYEWLNLIRAYQELGDANKTDELTAESVKRFPECSLFFQLRGLCLSTKGKTEAAIEALQRSIELSPGVQSNYSILLHCLLQGESYPEAETWCRRWIEVAPTSNKAYRWLGLILHKQGNYHKAIGSFDTALSYDPGDSRAYLYRGRSLTRLHRLQDALNDLDRACEMNPNDPEVYLLRADTLYALKKYATAADDLTRCLSFEPKHARYLYLRGDCYRRLGKLEVSLADLEQAIKLDGNRATYYDRRGLVRAGLGQSDLAIEDYRKALQLNPLERYVNDHLVKALLTQGDNEAAISQCEIWQQAEPDLGKPWVAKGEVWRSIGENQKALEAYAEAIKREPNDPHAYLCRGKVYMALGQPAKALAEYNRALENNPKYTAVYYSRGIAKRELGHYQEAIGDLTRAINFGSKDRWIYLYRAECFRQLQQYEAALSDIDVALQNGSDLAATIGYRCRIFNAQGRYREALNVYYSALSYDPPPTYTHLGIIVTHAALGEWKSGVEYVDRWLEEDPSNHEAFRSRGYLQYLSGDYPAALNDFDRAEQSMPEDYLTAFYRGLTLFALRRLDQARASIKQSVALCPNSSVGEHQRNVGELFAQLGHWQEAVEYLSKSVGSQPRDLAASRMLAIAQLQLRDLEGCANTCDELLRELGQSPAPSIAQQIASTFSLGSVQEGGDQLLALANLAFESIPESSSTHCTLGAILFRLGMPRDAISHLAEAEMLFDEKSPLPERAIVHSYQAMAHQAIEESSVAEEYLEKASDIDLTWPQHAFRGVNQLPRWFPYREAQLLRSEAAQLLEKKTTESGKHMSSEAVSGD